MWSYKLIENPLIGVIRGVRRGHSQHGPAELPGRFLLLPWLLDDDLEGDGGYKEDGGDGPEGWEVAEAGEEEARGDGTRGVAYVPEAAEDTHGGAVPPRLAHLRHHGRRGGGHHGLPQAEDQGEAAEGYEGFGRGVEDEGDDAEQHPRRDEGLPAVDVGDPAHDGADED